MKMFQAIKSWKVKALEKVTVEPTLFFYYLAIYLLFGGFQNMIFGKVCQGHFNATFCTDGNLTSHTEAFDLVQKDSSKWIKYCTMAMVLPSIVTDCFLGAWSDHFGRKITLLLPPIGGFLSSVVYSCQAAFPSIGVEWAMLASALMGGFGSFTSMQTGVVAYMSSVTSKGKDRTLRISIVESMTFVSGTFGPFVSGQIVSKFGNLCLFLCIASCHICGLVYTTFRVENIKPKRTQVEDSKSDKNCQTTLRSLFPLSYLKDSVMVCLKARPNGDRARLIFLFLMAFILMIISTGEMDILFLFVREKPMEWDIQLFSYWFGTSFGINSLALLVAVPLAQRAGASDYLICAIGIVSRMASLLLLGFSTSTAMGFSVLLVGCLRGVPMTMLRVMISKCVDVEDQGKLFGVFAVLEDICCLLGAAIFNSIFPIIRSVFSGGLFVASAIALLPILIGLFLLDCVQKRQLIVTKL